MNDTTNHTLTLSVTESNDLRRVELFYDGACVFSRVAHNKVEFKDIIYSAQQAIAETLNVVAVQS